MNISQLNEQKNQKKNNSNNISYDDNLKVYIRVRPPLMREKDSSLPFRSVASVSDDKTTISLIEYLGFEFDEASKQRDLIDNPSHFLPHPYTFDHIFDMESTQDDVYKTAAVPAVESLISGYNSTIFAYGQTGTGKTYTMEGFSYNYTSPKKGLIPRAIENIFKYIENNSNSDTTFIIRVTYLQIYNESIDDLLKSEKNHLSIRESQKKGIYVEGLSEWAVCSPNDIYALLERGAQSRTKAHTNMNDVSSRSHAIFTIILEQMKISKGKKKYKSGKLNMVDLAGSERVKISGATGKQLDESRRINKSLSALGNVINALTDPKTKHIPYRDSKLTRLLQNSLGGNCKTSMIAMISPYDGSFNESLSTLNFAKRAKCIRIKASINEEVNQSALISQYETELNRLRKELDEKNQIINSNAFIKKIEMEKLQAEKDKNEALQALEKASLRFLQEREEKRKLEKKIEIMKFQMIPGGQKVKIEDTPEFKTLLQKHQILLQKDFNEKLNDLEKEKELIQISKEQVDSYNDLLNKQKETMETLTNNLKEKEDNINHLNEMIDSYEKIINEQDNIIEIKNQRIKLLENILIKNKVSFPKDTIIQTNFYGNNKDNKELNFNNDIKDNIQDDDIIIEIKNKNLKKDDKEDKINSNDKLIEFNNINNDEYKKNDYFNVDEKIIIKFKDSGKKNKDNETENRFSENNDNFEDIDNKVNYEIKSNKSKIINKEIINDNNADIKKDLIPSNTLINNNKNIENEISLENIGNNKNFEDNEDFNVVISGTFLKSKNNKNQENINKFENNKNSGNLSSISSDIDKEKEKIKSSKNTRLTNNYSIESKDKISFIINSNEKKKNKRNIQTPDIPFNNRSRSKIKAQNKSSKINTYTKEKK